MSFPPTIYPAYVAPTGGYGPNLILNSTFPGPNLSTPSFWVVAGTPLWVWDSGGDGGRAKLNNSNSAGETLTSPGVLAANKTYLIEYDVVIVTGSLNLSMTDTTPSSYAVSTTQHVSLTVTRGSSTGPYELIFRRLAAGGACTAYLDNVTCRQVL